MSKTSRTFLPAAGRDWLLPFYDPFVKLIGGGAALEALLDQATLEKGQRVLDIGCGTGTLATMIKRAHPDIDVVGLDPDVRALDRARRKAAQAGLTIRFDQGFGDTLPYPDASFDRVFSSFMLHHLPSDQKEGTLREVRRVLRPGGSLHLVDFGGSQGPGGGFMAHVPHLAEHLRAGAGNRVVEVMSRAGLADAQQVGRRRIPFGRVAYYRAGV